MKIMKKVYLLFILFIVFSFKSFCQADADVQKILDQLSTKIKSAKGINATFVLKQADKYGHPMVNADGVVKIKGNKYYLKEDNAEVYCNGIQVWNFDGDREVTVSKATNEDDDITPQQILSGFNKNDFIYKLLSSGANVHQVLLTPVDKRKNFKQVVLFINKSTHLITKANITDKIGVITEIDFSAINLNATLPDSQFVFDNSKHPNTEIINQ